MKIKAAGTERGVFFRSQRYQKEGRGREENKPCMSKMAMQIFCINPRAGALVFITTVGIIPFLLLTPSPNIFRIARLIYLSFFKWEKLVRFFLESTMKVEETLFDTISRKIKTRTTRKKKRLRDYLNCKRVENSPRLKKFFPPIEISFKIIKNWKKRIYEFKKICSTPLEEVFPRTLFNRTSKILKFYPTAANWCNVIFIFKYKSGTTRRANEFFSQREKKKFIITKYHASVYSNPHKSHLTVKDICGKLFIFFHWIQPEMETLVAKYAW